MTFALSLPLQAADQPPAWTVDLPARPLGAAFVAAGAPEEGGERRAWQALEGGRLLSADLDTGRGVEVRDLAAGFVGGCVRDGQHLWWAEPAGRVVVVSLPGLEEVRHWDLGIEPLYPPLPAAGMAVVVGRSSLVILDPEEEVPLAVHRLEGRICAAPDAWRQRLVVPVSLEAGGGRVEIFDLRRPASPPVDHLTLDGAPGPPAIRGDGIWVGDDSGFLSAFRFRGGTHRGAKRIWRRRTGGPVPVRPVPVLGGVIWVARDNWLRMDDATTGLPRSTLRLPRRVSHPLLLLARGRVIVAAEGSHRLVEADLLAGGLSRSWSTGLEHDLVQTPPARGRRGHWMLASFGPYRWRLAAFELQARPPAPAPGGGQDPAEGGEAPAAEAQADPRPEQEEGTESP